jgi:valyl-tRNA synthetase
MINKTKVMVDIAIAQYKNYDIYLAKKTIEDFFWHDFCDDYLEIVKKRVYENKPGKKSAQYVLYECLVSVLKMIAPIMPFITEEIYLTYLVNNEKEKSIHLTKFPEIKSEEKVEAGDLFIDILSKVRQEKSNAKKSMKSEIMLHLGKEEMDKIKELIEDLKDVTCAKEIKEGKFRVEFL